MEPIDIKIQSAISLEQITCQSTVSIFINSIQKAIKEVITVMDFKLD